MTRIPVRGTPKGRMVDPQALSQIRALIGAGPRRRDLLIEYLHRIQDGCGHISAAHIVALAAEMKLATTEVYEVATFYHHFDVVKEEHAVPPRFTVRVCTSLACQMAGSEDLRLALDNLSLPDVRVMPVPCVGRCHAAPVAVVGKNPIDQASIAGVTGALRECAIEPAIAPYVAYPEYRDAGGYQTLQQCQSGSRDRETVIQAMEHSGLRGLGGAGFPAGRKWRSVRAEAEPRLMAVNIDEGEPGTFKDRWYLERDPHRFLEGMLIAAQVVGIEEIYIYLRDEYAACRVILSRELDALRADPPCPLPQMYLRRGAGAYICGEESAMMESIEGRRGMPRLRPPYVAQVGLFGRPTLEHNLETLYWVRDILERGADWYTGHGRNGRHGLRSFSVSGRVRNPGVHLAPAGITLRQLINEYCGGMLPGHELYAYLPGGASGGILPAGLADLPLDFDAPKVVPAGDAPKEAPCPEGNGPGPLGGTLQDHGCFIGSAAVIVLSQHDTARDAATNMLDFFADESCGQCTPCRVGTAKAAALLRAPVWDQALLEDLAQAMADASICGLGQAAPNPIRCVIKYFPHEITP